jgi:Rhomboid family
VVVDVPGQVEILGNMLFLWIFGESANEAVRHVVIAICYLACGIVAIAFFYVINPHSEIPCIGASGAISGMMGMYMVLAIHDLPVLRQQGASDARRQRHFPTMQGEAPRRRGGKCCSRGAVANQCAHVDCPRNRTGGLGMGGEDVLHLLATLTVRTRSRGLLEDPAYSQRASEIATKVRQEEGVKAACDALESLFQIGVTPR